MKVISVTKNIPKESTLPDGYYYGTWSAYSVQVIYKEDSYNLTVNEGVRGIGYKVVVIVENGNYIIKQINN